MTAPATVAWLVPSERAGWCPRCIDGFVARNPLAFNLMPATEVEAAGKACVKCGLPLVAELGTGAHAIAQGEGQMAPMRLCSCEHHVGCESACVYCGGLRPRPDVRMDLARPGIEDLRPLPESYEDAEAVARQAIQHLAVEFDEAPWLIADRAQRWATDALEEAELARREEEADRLADEARIDRRAA